MLACSLLTINTTTMPSVHDTLSQDTTSVSDALWAMVDKELDTTYRSYDYLDEDTTPSSSSEAITSSDRMKISIGATASSTIAASIARLSPW